MISKEAEEMQHKIERVRVYAPCNDTYAFSTKEQDSRLQLTSSYRLFSCLWTKGGSSSSRAPLTSSLWGQCAKADGETATLELWHMFYPRMHTDIIVNVCGRINFPLRVSATRAGFKEGNHRSHLAESDANTWESEPSLSCITIWLRAGSCVTICHIQGGWIPKTDKHRHQNRWGLLAYHTNINIIPRWRTIWLYKMLCVIREILLSVFSLLLWALTNSSV